MAQRVRLPGGRSEAERGDDPQPPAAPRRPSRPRTDHGPRYRQIGPAGRWLRLTAGSYTGRALGCGVMAPLLLVLVLVILSLPLLFILLLLFRFGGAWVQAIDSRSTG